MNGTPNAATFGSPDPNTGAYGNNPNPNNPTRNAVSPMVQQLQNFGRNNDTQLVHMTPGEVSGLQALAKAHGGSLTTNPHTGLPEAGFLENILPTLLGVGLSFIPGVGPLMAAGITGVGTTAVTGDLNKGLMAGLGAFGGASLAGGLGIGASAGTALPGATISTTLPTAATTGAVPAAAAAPVNLAGVSSIVPNTMANASALGNLTSAAAPGAAATVAPTAALAGAAPGANAAEIALRTGAAAPSAAGNPMLSNLLGPELGAKAGTFGQKFANAAGENLMGTATKPSVMRTAAAAMGAGMPIMQAMQPEYEAYEPPKSKWNYQGPYKPQDRKVRFPTSTPTDREFSYFENSNPYPGYLTSTGELPEGFAEGGTTGGGMPEISPQEIAALQALRGPQTLPPMQTLPAAPPPNPAQFTTVQSSPAASIYGAPQVQLAPQQQRMTGLQEARAGLPSMQDFLGSMKRAPTAGPMTFSPFKTEKEIFDAKKPVTPAPDTTGTLNPTPGGTNPVVGTGGGGGGGTSGTFNDNLDGDTFGQDTDTYVGGGTYVDPGNTGVTFDGSSTGTGGGGGFTYDVSNDLNGGRFEGFGSNGGFTAGTGTFVDPGNTGFTFDGVNGGGGADTFSGFNYNDFNGLDTTSGFDGLSGTGGGADTFSGFGNNFNGLDTTSGFDGLSGTGGGADTFSGFGNNFNGLDTTAGFDGLDGGTGGGADTFSGFGNNFNGLDTTAGFDGLDGGTGGGADTFSGFGGGFNGFDSTAGFDGLDGGTGGGGDIFSGFGGGFNGFDSTVDFDAGSGGNDFSGLGLGRDAEMDYGGGSSFDTFGGYNGFDSGYYDDVAGFDVGGRGSFAAGGQVPLEDGAFIVDARTVAELGNGSSRAGQDLLAKYGGQTLHGPGDGVSDSIRANIGGKQDARVARDEVKFSPQAVAKIGGGDLHKGTKKLYAMMDRAQKARKSAQRGQNTGLQGILNR